MKLKVLFPLVTAGVMASSPGSAQVVESFDSLVNQVLDSENVANFYAGALNTELVSASIDITVNVSAVNSTSSSTSFGSSSDNFFEDLTNSFTDFSASGTSSTSGGNVFDLATGDLTGTFSDVSGSAQISDLTSSVTSETSSFTSSSSLTLSDVVSNFGDISTVAAGAVNDVDITLTQVGDTAIVEADYAAGTVGTGIDSTNITGGAIGVSMSAFNIAPVDGSVVMSFTNAAGAANKIETTAVGALNSGSITATFVGNNEAEATVTLPE